MSEMNLIEFMKSNVKMYAAILITGLVTHMYMFTNLFLNHDTAYNIFGRGATTDSGRWGLELTKWLIPVYNFPWLHGFISVALFALSSCVIIKLFHVESRLLQYFIGAVTVTFPALTSTFGFMFTASSYAVSFLLAVVSVYFLTGESKHSVILAIVLLIASLSIYQAYFFVASSLVVVLLLQRTVETGEHKLGQAIRYFLIMVFSLAAYYLLTMVILKVLRTTYNTYASNALNHSWSPGYMLEEVYWAYKVFCGIFLKGASGFVPTRLSMVFHLLLVGICCFKLFFLMKGKKKLLPDCILYLALLPLSINGLLFITSRESVHALTLYSFVCVYFLAIVITGFPVSEKEKEKERNHKLFHNIVAALLGGIVMINIYSANIAYLKADLAIRNMEAFYTQLVTQVKQNPGFTKGVKLALVGNGTNMIPGMEEFKDGNMTGILDARDLINVYSRERYIKYFIGFDIEFASEAEIEKIKTTEEYLKMEEYPYYGSVSQIGNYIVVKFSQEES